MVWLSNALFVAAALGLIVVAVEHLSCIRHLRERTPEPTATPGISILKPLCGLDDDLEGTLACFAELDYPDYEVLLGVKDATDPAYAMATAVAARWPDRFRVLLQIGEPGLNAKVNQLLTLAPAAAYELLLISDSNVRVEPRYLQEIAAQLEDSSVGLVTHPIVGVGEESLGALFDRLHLASLVTPGIISGKRLVRQEFVVGKSMALRKSDLAAMGGLESVKDVLAEDFILGRRVGKLLGKEVRVAHRPVTNVSRQLGVWEFCQRYARWNVIQRVLIGRFLYAFQLLLNPLALALLGFVAYPTFRRGGAVLGIAVAKSLVDALSRRAQERRPVRLRHLLSTPLKDLVFAWSGAQAMV
ncbi:MAG: glycosyltransferase, partial [Deltaproteobacteria bacterium]